MIRAYNKVPLFLLLQFIDVLEGDRTYMPVLYVYNKIDSLWIEELDILDQLENVVPSTCCFVVVVMLLLLLSCCVVWLILVSLLCAMSM
jgi:hypothetical protein